MSEDPDPVLTELRSAAANAKAAADAVKGIDLAKIGQRAEEGAQRGASRAVADIPETARIIREAAYTLQLTLPAAREAAEWPSRRRWWVGGAIVLIALLGLSGAFVGGFMAGSGLSAYVRPPDMRTEAGCKYLGGSWSPKEDGSGLVCWQESYPE